MSNFTLISRKLIFMFLLVPLTCFHVLAQDKASAGNLTLEIGVDLIAREASILNQVNQLKGRYFSSEKSAVRVGFRFNTENDKTDILEEGTGNIGTIVGNTTTFSLTLGYENHFGDWDRVSPYFGAEALLILRNANQKYTNTNGLSYVEDYEMTVKGAHLDNNGFLTERSAFGYGLRLLAGWDIYFAGPAYIGFEAGFGILIENEPEVEETEQGNTLILATKSRDLSFGNSFTGGVRVGLIIK